MDRNIIKYLLALTFVLPIYAAHANENDTSEEREPRSNRRVVKLYSGTRPKPIVCNGEGFQPDPDDCAAFHRCLKSGNGRYLSFRFQCGPGTIFDSDTGICNHPKSTKRSECGGRLLSSDFPTNNNEIIQEVPSPISTKESVYTNQNSYVKSSTMLWSTVHSQLSSTTTMSHLTAVSNRNRAISLNSKNLESISTNSPPINRQSIDFTDKLKYTTPREVTFNNRHLNLQFSSICTSDGLIGDSEDCRKFYRCVGNKRGGFIRYEFLCSNPTIWDDDKHTCNHDWAVKRSRCGRENKLNEELNDLTRINTAFVNEKKYGKNVTDKSAIQTQLQINYGERVKQTQTQISKSSNVQNQTQINYGDRNSEHQKQVVQNQTQIAHGSSVSQTQTQINYGDKGVQTQLQIDHSGGSSQSQTQVSESNSTKFTTTSSITHEQNILTSNNACSESGFRGDNNDCRKFYRCVDNGKGGFTRYEFSCSDGTVWDTSIESCNHAWAVKECGGKGSGTSTQSFTETTQSPTHVAQNTTTLVQSLSTTTSTTTQSYNPSEEFEPDDNDIPYGNQPSLSETTNSPMTTAKEQQNAVSSKCTSSGFMGNNKDCKKFYRCVDNGNGGFTQFEFSCGEGTVWDSQIAACNHAWAVLTCGGNNNNDLNENISTTITTTTTQLSTLMQESSSSSIPFNDDYDTGYGMHNDETGPNSSTVIDRTTTIDITTSTSTTQLQNESKCKTSGFMGDANDCKKFYRCVDNGNGGFIKYDFTCGEGTVWDEKNQACNHVWAVEKCGGTMTENINPTDTTSPNTTFTTTSTATVDLFPDNNEVGYGQENNESPSTSTIHNKPESPITDSSDCKSSGFMGDRIDCKKFYRCVDNGNGGFTRYEFACGEGTVWDPKIDACNHAWAVENCSNNESQTVQTTSQANSINDDDNNVGYPIQNDEITEKPDINGESTTPSTLTSSSTTSRECKESGFMEDLEDCKKFYRCVADDRGAFIRYEFTCGEGTAWDQTIEACNHQENVKNCGQLGNASENVHQITQLTSTQASNSETDGNNQEYQSSTHKTSTTTSSSKPSDNRCSQEGFYGDVNNCRNFYRCVNNGKGGYTKYEFTCGEGTIWNQKIQACDHESSGKENCQVNNSDIDNDETHTETPTKGPTSSTSSTENETSEKPKPSDNKCESEGFFSDANECKNFYRCVDNGQGSFTKYEFVCGDGTFWDQETLTCDHEYNNDKCKSILVSTSTTKTETNSENTENIIHNSETTSQSTSLEDLCSSEGFFTNSNDCKKFYRCVNNGKGGFTKYDFTCGEGTIWVQEIQVCDHDRGQSNCSDLSNSSKPQITEIYSTTLSYSSTLPQSESSGKEDDEYSNEDSNKPSSSGACTSEGFYANKDDCTKFYRCVDNGQGNFTRYDFTCGQGTAWNDDIQTCDHIDQVKNCSNSNHQQQDSQTNPVMDDQNSSQSTESTSSSGSTSSESLLVNIDTCKQEGYFGNSNDCTKFFRCVDNGNGGLTKYDFDCGEGTIWDQDLTTCNHPQDVANPSCKNNAASTTGESSNAASESSSTTNSSSGTSTASSNSTEDGSQNTSNCSQESTTKKPSSQKIKCKEAGYYPNPDDCKKFYRCVDWDGNGKKFSVYNFECGEGTIWDPELQTCNHEDSVYPPRDCSGTQNQNENVAQETTTTEKSTTAQENTTSEETAQEQTTQTTSEKTTQQTTSGEETTTQQTTEQSLTEQTTTSSQQTTEQSTTQQTTTSSQPTTKQSTTQQTTTSSQQTTQETTSEQTATQQSTSSKQTTTQQSTTSEQTTQSSSNEQTTTTQATNEGQATTTEQTHTEQSTTDQSATEQSTSEQSTTEQSTTEQSTTEQSTTEQTTTSTVDQSVTSSEQTEQSTTESTTQQTTESDSTTTEASKTTTENTNNSSTTENNQESSTEDNNLSDKECPETEENQYLYVCPTSFRRHPKYCNMFYQCTEDDDSHEIKIATFTCPNNTIYDESKTQCVEEDKADKRCNGEIARRFRVKRLNSYSKEPIEASHNKYACSAEGNYPFEIGNECSGGFLKCDKSKSGQIRSYVYRCPEGFIYWSISKRCEKKDYMKDCKQSSNDWRQRWEIPVETKNLAK